MEFPYLLGVATKSYREDQAWHQTTEFGIPGWAPNAEGFSMMVIRLEYV
jgi:hypothetical protein